MPGSVIDVEAVIDDFRTVAIINLGPHQVGQAHLPAAEYREWQLQPALRLVSGVVDDDDMAAAVLAGPGVGDEAIRGPVVGPCRLRLDLRPDVAVKGAVLLHH